MERESKAVADQASAFRPTAIGLIAQLELIPEDSTPSGDIAVIEGRLRASQYRELGLTKGELLVLTPRKARVFVEESPDLVQTV